MPQLSIITVNLNNRAGLGLTIASVRSQTFRDFEFVVVDGGSTDGSLEVVEQHRAGIDHCISETDTGIYHAMNKGIRLATGEYCLFLNSGDRLADPGVLKTVFHARSPAADIVYGDLQTPGGRCSYPATITLGTFFRSSIGHPAAFIRRRLFEQCGHYNESLRIAADWEFFITAFVLHNCSYQHLDVVVSFFDDGGISSGETARAILNEEREEVLRRLVPAMYDDYIAHIRDQDELQYYRKSRLVQLIRRIQSSDLYNRLRPARGRSVSA